MKTTISPRIQERLAEVLVDQNDVVKTGQLLARLDDGELRTQVEVAEAVRVAARASLERVKTDEARALAVARQTRVDYQRIADLLTNRISSEADFDKAVEQVKVAEADVKRSQAAIAEAETQRPARIESCFEPTIKTVIAYAACRIAYDATTTACVCTFSHVAATNGIERGPRSAFFATPRQES